MLLTDYKWFQALPAPSSKNDHPRLIVRRLGLQDYEPIWQSMRYLAQQLKDKGKTDRADEIW